MTRRWRTLNDRAVTVQKDAEAKIRALEGGVAAAKEAAEKERKTVAGKVEGPEKDFAGAEEAGEKAGKEAANKADWPMWRCDAAQPASGGNLPAALHLEWTPRVRAAGTGVGRPAEQRSHALRPGVQADSPR